MKFVIKAKKYIKKYNSSKLNSCGNDNSIILKP